MTKTVVGLIKSRDGEAGSSEAVEQEVSGATEAKRGALENGKMIVVPLPHHIPH